METEDGGRGGDPSALCLPIMIGYYACACCCCCCCLPSVAFAQTWQPLMATRKNINQKPFNQSLSSLAAHFSFISNQAFISNSNLLPTLQVHILNTEGVSIHKRARQRLLWSLMLMHRNRISFPIPSSAVFWGESNCSPFDQTRHPGTITRSYLANILPGQLNLQYQIKLVINNGVYRTRYIYGGTSVLVRKLNPLIDLWQ